MTLRDFFWGLGDFVQEYLLVFLQNDFPITSIMNTGLLLLGFVGFIIWMNKQRKFNANAISNPKQRK